MTDTSDNDQAPIAPTPPSPALTSEALKPAGPSLLAEIEAQAAAANKVAEAGRQATLASTASVPRRGRGRPPGSKNKSTLERERIAASLPPPRQPNVPPSETPKREPPTAEEILAKKRARESRANDISAKIQEDLNDGIMMLLVSMGVPAELLYKEGYVPEHQVKASKFTPLASNVVVGPLQANVYGKFLAALEDTETGRKVTGNTSTGNGPLIVYGLLSIAASVQYVQGLSQFTKNISPILEAYKAAQLTEQTKRAAEEAAANQEVGFNGTANLR